MLTTGKTFAESQELVYSLNSEPFHRRHAQTVAAVMGWFAEQLGHGDEKDFWQQVGLLHDVDFEKWPDAHCVKAKELLAQQGYTPELIHAVACHGYGLTGVEDKPELEMEKVLFAADELTGLIGAAALMRPSKSCKDMELKSLKKKYKDKKFAAGCSREVIAQGAEDLGWELDKLLELTLQAMAGTEDAIEAALGA